MSYAAKDSAPVFHSHPRHFLLLYFGESKQKMKCFTTYDPISLHRETLPSGTAASYLLYEASSTMSYMHIFTCENAKKAFPKTSLRFAHLNKS